MFTPLPCIFPRIGSTNIGMPWPWMIFALSTWDPRDPGKALIPKNSFFFQLNIPGNDPIIPQDNQASLPVSWLAPDGREKGKSQIVPTKKIYLGDERRNSLGNVQEPGMAEITLVFSREKIPGENSSPVLVLKLHSGYLKSEFPALEGFWDKLKRRSTQDTNHSIIQIEFHEEF